MLRVIDFFLGSVGDPIFWNGSNLHWKWKTENLKHFLSSVLDVIVDEKLSWFHHIAAAKSKMSRRISHE